MTAKEFIAKWKIRTGWGEYRRAKELIVELLSGEEAPDLEYDEIVSALMNRCKI